MKNYLLLLLAIIFTTGLSAQGRTEVEGQRAELGKVSWYRNYDQALALAEKSGKPVLILFQEVPGCATCQRYGTSTLSHPLMVEAIENEFIPLAIFNNKGGDDARVLAKFGEPSWNNPVVRIVDEKGKNLVDRVAGNYSPQGLYAAMAQTLISRQKTIPGYMEVLGLELSASAAPVKEAYYQMYCFWSGEHHLGNNDAVLTTEPGFLNGHEVVKVKYDPAKANEAQLAQYAAQKDIKQVKGNAGYRIAAKDHYYQLQQTDYVYLPLTEVQKTKMNAAYGRGEDLGRFLSPRQKAFMTLIKKDRKPASKLYALNFDEAWQTMLGLSKK
ncbi:thioredoxin family protein [Neolewinella aurantiaca]|uniref:Thioredoxin family protein n=1 Tax=Neolewinella aurantiaca TaxID=2602767 RepID=A0A5C7FF31_9BACT|nr:VPGUxxT family thioredoxin-like (seleno)protein, type 2 [Neolewinella aurantiaca]TXF89774.1 thioredoxin family protein [Neolewinella aurantiaca]